ncbi:hypothetical protein IFM47457_06097 [Aspergillus lentulus]|nr:hypothetical protein IFM47457_06097 [Aspergillus lentulus]
MNQRPGNAWAHCVEKAATRYVVQYDDARGRALMGAFNHNGWLSASWPYTYIPLQIQTNLLQEETKYHLSVIVEAEAKVALIPRGRGNRTKRRSIERKEVLGTTDRKQPATL